MIPQVFLVPHRSGTGQFTGLLRCQLCSAVFNPDVNNLDGTFKAFQDHVREQHTEFRAGTAPKKEAASE